MGSASALRGIKRASTSCSARGARTAYVQAVGLEAASHKVQIHLIAHNFVDKPTYFPPEVQANPRFRDRLAHERHWGAWSARKKTPNSPLTCAATAPTVSSARWFPYAVGG